MPGGGSIGVAPQDRLANRGPQFWDGLPGCCRQHVGLHLGGDFFGNVLGSPAAR